MTTPKPLKQKKCRICKEKFTPKMPLQTACSPRCALEHAKAVRYKKERTEHRIAKEKLKRKSDYVREAQTAFNSYIRERDKELPCISCQRFHTGQYHAGHFRATSVAPSLRFNELNVHKQCSACNTHLHGNLLEYRINLVNLIGKEKVDWLESNHQPMHYTIEELKEIKQKYSKMARDLVKLRQGE